MVNKGLPVVLMLWWWGNWLNSLPAISFPAGTHTNECLGFYYYIWSLPATYPQKVDKHEAVVIYGVFWGNIMRLKDGTFCGVSTCISLDFHALWSIKAPTKLWLLPGLALYGSFVAREEEEWSRSSQLTCEHQVSFFFDKFSFRSPDVNIWFYCCSCSTLRFDQISLHDGNLTSQIWRVGRSLGSQFREALLYSIFPLTLRQTSPADHSRRSCSRIKVVQIFRWLRYCVHLNELVAKLKSRWMFDVMCNLRTHGHKRKHIDWSKIRQAAKNSCSEIRSWMT